MFRNRGVFRPIRAIGRAAGRARQFVLRQKPSYRITVTRAALSSFLAGFTAQYNSIYAVALGARPGVRLHHRDCPGHGPAAPTANDDSRDVTEREGLTMFAYAEMPQTWRRQAHGALVVVKKNVLRLPRMSHLQDPDASVGLAGGGTGCCQT